MRMDNRLRTDESPEKKLIWRCPGMETIATCMLMLIKQNQVVGVEHVVSSVQGFRRQKPPEEETTKVNVDGAFTANDITGAGMILRDHKGTGRRKPAIVLESHCAEAIRGIQAQRCGVPELVCGES